MVFAAWFWLRLLAIVCAAGTTTRVRRELRTLTNKERDDLFDALWIMKDTNRSFGQTTFGRDFQPYDYFTVKHCVAVVDKRGDQGHFGPCFMTYHRAFLLEFEASLLAVLKAKKSTITGLPYWDATLDSDTGPFFQDPERWIFSDEFFGGYTGNASHNFTVTSGRVARWPVRHFDEALVPEDWRARVLGVYRGNPYTGLLRGPNNLANAPFVTRFPKMGFPTLDGHNDIIYTVADAQLCMNAQWVRDWMEWQDCIENGRARRRQSNATAFWNHASGLHWMHSQFHAKIGSYQEPWPNDFPFMSPTLNLTMGDMMDVATSPNDPLFPFHHANVDRLNMAWQKDAMRKVPDLPSRNWGYPVNTTVWKAIAESAPPEIGAANIWHAAKDGCGLNDVASSNFPFTKLEGLPVAPAGYTHAEILRSTSFGRASYTYDTLEASVGKFFV